MFCSPYTHGPRAVDYLHQFTGLLQRCLPAEQLESNVDWIAFKQTTLQIMKLFEKLTFIKDRDLLYTLYSYMWEMKEEVQLLQAFIGTSGLNGALLVH